MEFAQLTGILKIVLVILFTCFGALATALYVDSVRIKDDEGASAFGWMAAAIISLDVIILINLMRGV